MVFSHLHVYIGGYLENTSPRQVVLKLLKQNSINKQSMRLETIKLVLSFYNSKSMKLQIIIFVNC